MSDPKIVVLVSSDPSDLYFANQITKQANVVGVLVGRQVQMVVMLGQILTVFQYLKSPVTFYRKLFAAGTQRYYARKASTISRVGFGNEGYELNRAENCQILCVEEK